MSEELEATLRRLSKVGFGYDMSGDDKAALVRAAEVIAAWNRRTPPRVKALEWELHYTGYHAQSPLGYFEVFPSTRAAHWYWRHECDAEIDQVPPMQRGDDADEAKAAAQADFERRVHACLEGYDD